MIPAIDITDLIGRPGASKEHRVDSPIEGLGTGLARVRDDVPVEGDLLLEALVEGILVSGTLGATLALRCARCLTEFEQPFEVTVHELFVPVPEPDGDDYPLDRDGFLEPDQMVRDAIGVELPFSPLCRPDCQGLCPVCGGDRNLGECPGHAEIDPRWAALEQLAPLLDEN
ncbi:MAG TPA: YceD family protein [Actinomycetota bacterium]|nr:YceD family protein [Actinomycetota bacterium]